VVFYESGKLVVQGRARRNFIEFVLGREVLKQAPAGLRDDSESRFAADAHRRG